MFGAALTSYVVLLMDHMCDLKYVTFIFFFLSKSSNQSKIFYFFFGHIFCLLCVA